MIDNHQKLTRNAHDSFYSTGVWFEGAMTTGCSSDKTVDDAIQANIVAAKFVAP